MSNIYIQEPPTNGKVLLKTTVGDIDIELWSKEAPKACRNFVQLCMEGYYDNTIFHRIVKGFCIQGGDPTGTGTGGESIYGHPFKDEFHQRLRFVRRGLVAMANAGSNDNSSQFFFTLGRADELNGKHTIFGKVTGDTVYNMIKMEDCDVDQDDRPLYPPKINTTEVLSNPFDDIEPRELVKKKTKQGDEKLKKAKTKGTKNFSLLSFGEEAEEDEQEVLTTSKTLKIKSSHDVLDDPRLSAEPALQSALDQTEDDYDEKMRERVKEKLRKQKQIEKNEELREPDKEDRGKALKEESKRLAKEIREAKRRKIEEDEEEKQSDQNKEKNHKVSDTVAEFREERESYLAKKKSQRKGGSRENDTLDLLAGFQSKLDAVGDEGDESEGNLENEDDDSGWMQHALRFETRSNKVKDANIQDEDTFEIFDPRNPINKRRREASKESRERKKGSRR